MLNIMTITALLFSVSLRTANISDMPYDYEIYGSLKGGYNRIAFLKERENGLYYKGHDVRLKAGYCELGIYDKTAKKINYQKLSALYPFKSFSLGVSYMSIHWEDAKILATAKYSNGLITAFYSRGYESENYDVEISKAYKIYDKISLVPLILVKSYNDKFFWQTKIGLLYNIN